jgi:N-acetyl-anhydromuramyl-L-alanine amidase AmpD
MKRSLLTPLFVLISVAAFAFKSIPENNYANAFAKAYKENPTVPKGMLEAIAFTNTRFTHLDGNEQESCLGIPKAYGVMGLTLDGKGYFRNNLVYISQLSGYSVKDITESPEKNILAFAKAYASIRATMDFDHGGLEEEIPVIIALSELPDGDIAQNFALASHVYAVLSFLDSPEYQSAYGFPAQTINFNRGFGDNLDILRSSQVTIAGKNISNNNGQTYKADPSLSTQSTDYGPAIWNPAASCNYSSRNGTLVSAVTIHTVQGTYAGCISWFQNCNAGVSAHYVLRSSDGQVTQMVSEAQKAWHVGSENPYTIGLEHEGYINTASWYTNAMYQGSANLVRDICNSGYGINPLRTYYGPGCSGGSSTCGIGACTKIKGHQMYPNQSHTDPGPNWNWAYYYLLINNNPTVTSYTTASGTFYDSGGSTGNYADDERKLYLISPTGATTVTLNFSSFDTEAGWDYMFIYDGNSTSAPLIGSYDGTNTPGTVSSSGGSILVEFRSDCATTSPGWACSWSSNANPPPAADNIAPTTQIQTMPTWQTASFNVSFTDADNAGGSGLEKSFYQVIDFDGTDWRANASRGFFSDNFDFALHPDWTVSTGTWNTNNSTLNETDETVSNTNIYASLTQNLSNRYLYHWSGMIGGTGTNRRAGFHFFSDNGSLPNRGNSYFVWFRVDQNELQFYKVTNDVFSLVSSSVVTFNANQWYDYKVIYDRITGKMDVYVDNILVGSWTDPSPYSNGSYISFRSGNSTWSVNNFKVYRSRAATVTVNVGTASNSDIRYENTSPTTPAGRVKSIVRDTAGNLSTIAYQDINVDWTAPMNVAIVNDGGSNDIDTIYTNTQLETNWSVSADPNSDVSRYWYAIGTSPGAADVIPWTDNWFYDTVFVSSLSLTYGQTYYTTVQVENGAGLLSGYSYSDGQLLPLLTTSVGEENNEFGMMVYPNPANAHTTLYYDLSSAAKVEIKLVDMLGKEIMLLADNENAGKHLVSIDRDALKLSKGMYLIRMKVNEKECSIKMLNN